MCGNWANGLGFKECAGKSIRFHGVYAFLTSFDASAD